MKKYKSIGEFVLDSKKAIVPLGVGALVLVLAKVGIAKDMTVEQALTLVVSVVVTSVGVWFTKNGKK